MRCQANLNAKAASMDLTRIDVNTAENETMNQQQLKSGIEKKS